LLIFDYHVNGFAGSAKMLDRVDAQVTDSAGKTIATFVLTQDTRKESQNTRRSKVPFVG
jgi:hypothetical protein